MTLDIPGLEIVPDFIPEFFADAIWSIVQSEAERSINPGVNGIDHVQRLLLVEGCEMEIVGSPVAILWIYDAVSEYMGDIDSIIATRYRRGASLDYHIDPLHWSDTICVLNLGGSVTVGFKNVADGTTHFVVFPDRSLMVMSGDARYKLYHGIDVVDHDRMAIVCRKLAI
jgi:hypothetical protein